MGAGAVILMTRPCPRVTLSFTGGYGPQPRWGQRAERERDGTIRGQTNWGTVRLLAPEGSRNVATGQAAAAKPADAQPVEPDLSSSSFLEPRRGDGVICVRYREKSEADRRCGTTRALSCRRQLPLPYVLFIEYKFLVECFQEIRKW